MQIVSAGDNLHKMSKPILASEDNLHEMSKLNFYKKEKNMSDCHPLKFLPGILSIKSRGIDSASFRYCVKEQVTLIRVLSFPFALLNLSRKWCREGEFDLPQPLPLFLLPRLEVSTIAYIF